MLEHKFEIVPIAALTPYAGNARRRGKKQISKLASSMKEFGVTSPVVIDESGVIIAGHGRLEAAVQLGLKQLPAIRVSSLSDDQKRALRIADNRIAEDVHWNVDLLKQELEALSISELDLKLTGFDEIEVDRFLTPSLDLLSADKPLPPLNEEPACRTGDLWALGNHLLTVGDAREVSVFERLMGPEKAALVVSDLPYNVPIRGHASGKGRVKHDDFSMASGELSDPDFEAFLQTILGLTRDFSRDGSLHYVFSDWRMIGMLIAAGSKLYSQLMNIAVWVKANAGMGSFYRSQHELVAIFKHGTARHTNNIQLGRMGRYRSNVWQHPGASGFSKTRGKDLERHPTVKPLELIAEAIRDATMPGDLVLDPCGGSGTTLIAAELTGRRAALIEIDHKYADVTLRRYQEQTGIEPLLLPNRTPLSMVQTERKTKPEATVMNSEDEKSAKNAIEDPNARGEENETPMQAET